MFALSQNRLLNVIAAGALAAIAFVNTPRRRRRTGAELRPAGPHEPILASVGREARGGVLRDRNSALRGQCQRVGQYRGAGLSVRICSA